MTHPVLLKICLLLLQHNIQIFFTEGIATPRSPDPFHDNWAQTWKVIICINLADYGPPARGRILVLFSQIFEAVFLHSHATYTYKEKDTFCIIYA